MKDMMKKCSQKEWLLYLLEQYFFINNYLTLKEESMQIDGKDLTQSNKPRIKREFLFNYITLTKIQQYEI